MGIVDIGCVFFCFCLVDVFDELDVVDELGVFGDSDVGCVFCFFCFFDAFLLFWAGSGTSTGDGLCLRLDRSLPRPDGNVGINDGIVGNIDGSAGMVHWPGPEGSVGMVHWPGPGPDGTVGTVHWLGPGGSVGTVHWPGTDGTVGVNDGIIGLYAGMVELPRLSTRTISELINATALLNVENCRLIRPGDCKLDQSNCMNVSIITTLNRSPTILLRWLSINCILVPVRLSMLKSKL